MNTAEFQALIHQLAGSRVANEMPSLVSKLDALRNADDSVLVRPLHADEFVFLEAICQEIDAESDSDRAWELVGQITSCQCLARPKELDVKFQAIAKNLRGHTVGFWGKREGEWKIASGVLVEIDQRVFVATASHTIPSNPLRRLQFTSPEEQQLDPSVVRILNFGRVEENDPDVGFLEIPADYASKSLACTPISLDRIYPCGPGRPKALAYLVGYPVDLVRKSHDQRGYLLSSKPLVFLHQPLLPENWDMLIQARDDSSPPDADRDLFLPYPRDEEMRSPDAGDTNRLCEPYGLSGCGIWQPLVGVSSTIWSPEDYGLVAIQSRWPQRGRNLQATQIAHWLRLVFREIPAVAGPIQRAFPQLAGFFQCAS